MAVSGALEIGRRLVCPASTIVTHQNRADLLRALKGAHLNGKQMVITDPDLFKKLDLPMLAANVADFGDRSASESVKDLSAWMINEAAQQLGAKVASPQEMYVAIAEGKVQKQMSFPAVNIRANALETARALFRAAIDNNVGALIIEIARSEIGYTAQKPREFASVVLAAAVMEGFTGPVFLQGDHIQLKAKPVREGGEAGAKELAAHTALIRDLVLNGFGSIDLDMSTLERRGEAGLTHDQQQAENALWTARKIQEVRAMAAELGIAMTHLLGGETGEVGKMNTSAEDLAAYAEGIRANMVQLGLDPSLGIRKIAVNDGTSHGGVSLPDGSTAEVAIAFDVLRMATDKGREFGWAGSVQHGASTLPDNAFSLFPANGAVEVHLATAFQLTLLKHVAEKQPELYGQIVTFLNDKFGKERKPSQTDAQFVRGQSKNAMGPFKLAFWTMPEEVRAAVAEDLYTQFSFLFGQLGVTDTKDLVAANTTMHDFHRPFPEEIEATPAPAAPAAPAQPEDVKGLSD